MSLSVSLPPSLTLFYSFSSVVCSAIKYTKPHKTKLAQQAFLIDFHANGWSQLCSMPPFPPWCCPCLWPWQGVALKRPIDVWCVSEKFTIIFTHSIAATKRQMPTPGGDTLHTGHWTNTARHNCDRQPTNPPSKRPTERGATDDDDQWGRWRAKAKEKVFCVCGGPARRICWHILEKQFSKMLTHTHTEGQRERRGDSNYYNTHSPIHAKVQSSTHDCENGIAKVAHDEGELKSCTIFSFFFIPFLFSISVASLSYLFFYFFFYYAFFFVFVLFSFVIWQKYSSVLSPFFA